MPAIEIFCCYARKDQQLLNDLKIHLMPMQHSGHIHIWADTDIGAGKGWEKEIEKHLNTAQIILLLISPDFMASDYCYSIEMRRALERHKQGEARVVPIILRPTDWQNGPLGELQALPTGAKPVTSALWHNPDDAFLNVAEGVRKAVMEIQKETLPEGQHSQITEKIEVNGIVAGKKLKSMSNRVKAISIGAVVVIISALIGGIFWLHSATLAEMAKTIPTSAVILTTTAKSTPGSLVTPTATPIPGNMVAPTLTATPTSTSTSVPTPTPSTPTLVRPGTPFLDDPMTSFNNADQWDVVTEPYVTCGFSSGGYDVKVPANTVGGCSTNASTTNFTDFIYEIDMTIVSGVTNDTSPTRGAGLMFRYSNQSGASNYGVSFQQNGAYYLFTYNNGVPAANLGTGQCNSFYQGTNRQNLIDVKMQGSTITLFVNNVYVMTVTDNQFQSGQLGVQIGSGNDPSEVVYSNLKVWKL